MKQENNNQIIKTYVIDLFCGAGGTSTAIHEAGTNIEVVACVNHDRNAIMSHAANYPDCQHYVEDIRTIDLSPINVKIKHLRRQDPTCKIAIWASFECTNFSKAKCGPKDADSRTLAEHIFRYLDVFQPDFLWVENVEEFMDWGPLKEDGNPDKEKIGHDYQDWVLKLKNDYGFDGYWNNKLISADYGGYTIRKRLFLQFAKEGHILGEPVKTHHKHGEELPKWNAVKKVLNLDNHGKSIFGRKKPFVQNTHRRLYKGLVKYGKDFSVCYYGASNAVDNNDPSPTLTTKDRVYPVFIKQDYGTSIGRSIDVPMATLTAVPKGDVVSFVHNPQYGGSNRSIDDPACTIIARQDKAPLGLTTAVKSEGNRQLNKGEGIYAAEHISVEEGTVHYNIFESDDDWMVKIKEHMFNHGLLDVMTRPLEVREMLRIQGFPEDYELRGTQTEAKKYIGNSVEVNVGKALFRAIDKQIQK